MRTGPAATGPGSEQSVSGSSPALEAKNARIANLERTNLVGDQGDKAFSLQGADAKKVSLTTVPVEGMPFVEAMRVELTEAASHEWAVQLQASNAVAIAEGDAILTTFYLRTVVPQEGGVGETKFVFELGRSPYTKSVEYPVQGSQGWSKVQVRFQSGGNYAPGDASLIFRLGYDPQTLDIAGIKVEDFGKKLPVGALPTTFAIDRRREKEALAAIKAAQENKPTSEGGDLRIEIAPGQVVRTISPYIYGVNSQRDDDIGVTVRRAGGNRQTAYNWEIDATNAGSDYQHSSDLWACTALGYKNCEQPAAQYVDFALANRHIKAESLVEIPIVDYVVADTKGPVAKNETAPSNRWLRSIAHKPTPFSLDPDLTDGVVYQDELINFLVQKVGKGDAGGIRFYALDNEPALWPSTHPRVHPEKTRYDEMVTRTEAAADAITKVDPSAFLLGATMFGWSEFMSLSEAPDAKEHNEKYGSYVDFFLASMKTLESKHHRRLVHALDVHWYPEAMGAKRITDKDFSPKTVAARLQAPRSLWDPTYTERSWIASQLGKPIRLIRWLRERIDERYPGTELAMTEYNFGVGDHISGGLAQADVLGVFGREGMYLANYWGDGAGNGELPPYIKTAFKLFRNYDGKHGTYGDTAVEAKAADLDKVSVFAAKDSKHPGTLTIIVINKDQHAVFNGKIDIKGGDYTKSQVFGFDSSKAEVRAMPAADLKGEHLEYRLQPLSATLFVLQ
jgi:hypothetical protein